MEVFAMEAKELAVVILGLAGTFLLPWPMSEVGAPQESYLTAQSAGIDGRASGAAEARSAPVLQTAALQAEGESGIRAGPAVCLLR
jgi:hypothetical protein